MKTGLLFANLLVLCLMQSCSTSKKVAGLSNADIAGLLQQQSYIFKATNMQPTGYRSRVLTTDYSFKVTKEQVVSELPYVGRAYTTNIGSTDGGMQFKSSDFSYTSADGKKGKKEITIKPKDISDIQEIFLTVFENGSADLRINSTSRQSISYTGNIVAVK